MFRKKIIAMFICSAFLIGGCGGEESSSTPPLHETIKEPSPIDEKLMHRLEQRGYDQHIVQIEENIINDSESEQVQDETSVSPAEKMAELGEWTTVTLVINELAEQLFHEQTLRYFEEDVYENYPPPRVNTIDAIGTMLSENEQGLVLDGVIRNGFVERDFTREELQPLQVRLMTGNNHAWAVTTLQTVEGFDRINQKEAVPFRITLNNEDILFPEFDYGQYYYFVALQQPTVDQSEESEEQDQGESGEQQEQSEGNEQQEEGEQ